MTAPARLTVVGDALLDRDIEGTVGRLAPEGLVPVVDEHEVRVRPGGAGLAAALAAHDGHDVTLVTALADDAAGQELRTVLDAAGVKVVDLGLDGATPEKIRLRAQGRTLLRLDRGGREARVGACTAAARAAINWGSGVLVSDYGRGVAAEPGVRAALTEAATAGAAIVWDPHPRGARPVRGCALCTPNEREAECFAPASVTEVSERARALRTAWGARGVCITLAGHGALLAEPGATPLAVPAVPAPAGDACGAGDRFAVRATEALARGASAFEAVIVAVTSATAFFAAGGAAALELDVPAGLAKRPDAVELAARLRAEGRSVVATGGCFDLLHPGHIGTLQAARTLGDALIVCVNSDASVRRLKGPGRPLVPQQDRVAVLEALACVDAVAVFDEDRPDRLLDRLRPHVWAKGGDYEGVRLPEDDVVRRWGGRAVVLPFLDGRSTSALIEKAVGHVA